MKTTITTTATHIAVTGDYNSEFVAAARKLAGKWQNPAWVFDIRNEPEVRAACQKFYGTDGFTSDLIDVEVEFGARVEPRTGPVEVFGRTVARAFGRDSGARLGDGIGMKQGKISSGGSARHWTTVIDAGTVVVIRDVSRSLVEEGSQQKGISCRILDSVPAVDVVALQAEKLRLEARLTEINLILDVQPKLVKPVCSNDSLSM